MVSRRFDLDDCEMLAQAISRHLSIKNIRAKVVITDNYRTMISVFRKKDTYTFRLHRMFIDAPLQIIEAISTYSMNQDPAATKLIRKFVAENDGIVKPKPPPRQLRLRGKPKGRWHNLQSIFDDLNHRYFERKIQASIVWGSRSTRKRCRKSIKLGSYTIEEKLIRMHPVLDSQDIPRYFVEWVIYHEMLHEIHEIPIVNGRRIYHTRAFRRDEAKFDQYAKASLWERSNIGRLLGR